MKLNVDNKFNVINNSAACTYWLETVFGENQPSIQAKTGKPAFEASQIVAPHRRCSASTPIQSWEFPTLNAALILISMSKGWCEYECPSRVEYIMIWSKQWYDMIFDLLYMIYDLWYMICGIWCMTCFDLIWFHLIWYDILYYVSMIHLVKWYQFPETNPKPSFFVVIDSADVQYKWMKNAFTLALCIAGRWANPQ